VTAGLTVEAVNALTRDEFIQRFGGVYEHSPWIATSVEPQRPFASRDALEQAMQQVVANAGRQRQVELLKAHPEFAGKAARAGTLTTESTQEQGRLSLNSLRGEQLDRMLRFNAHFMQKFGFPGIVCVRLHTRVEQIFAELDRRSQNTFDDEVQEALQQVFRIVKFRLDDLIP